MTAVSPHVVSGVSASRAQSSHDQAVAVTATRRPGDHGATDGDTLSSH